MSITVLAPLADGFEEVEAVAVIDVLRRAGAEVVVAALDGDQATSSHGLTILADTNLENVATWDFDCIALHGGVPGAANLAASETLTTMLKRHKEKGALLGAICAAPAVVLGAHGLLEGTQASCHPSVRDVMPEAYRTEDRVSVQGKVITGAGAGTAVEYALRIAEVLYGPEKVAELDRAMVVAGPAKAWT